MHRPLVFEVNTRCWLDKLSVDGGFPVTLAIVPDSEILSWVELGFTHIWLMGVWTTGPKARESSHSRAELRSLCVEAFGRGGEKYLAASPYAIAD
jgi:hypothetical protein